MSRRTRVRRSRWTWLKALVAAPLALLLVCTAALAYWSAESVPGGNGAAAATTVQVGNTPTAALVDSDITVNWVASTLANGDPVGGYLIRRYDADTQQPATMTAGCAGAITATSCTETGVPGGRWVYTVTPVIGTNWLGAESPRSNAITSDAVEPVNAITVTDAGGDAVRAGDTVYYRGVDAGSFTLTNAVTDADSGPASSETTALTGSSTGWSHASSTVTTPAGGPYVSNPFTWAAGTTSSPTEAVIGRDVVGNTAVTTVALVDDSTAPTAGTIDYPNGYQTEQSVPVTFTAGTDAGSGIDTRWLQRAEALLTSGVCGAFGDFADVGADNPASPYTDTAVSDGSCYQYRYVVTDRLGNARTTGSPNVAKLDSTFGGPPLRSVASFSVLGGTGVANTLGTNVSGDLGLSDSGLISGFPPGVVAGEIHDKDAVAGQARDDLLLAYANAASRTPTGLFSGDQNGKTFTPGVYYSGAASALTGTMTLDGAGDPNAIFVFQINAAMNTAAASHVVLINGAKASNVYWQVNGAATLGANSTMSGTIMTTGGITIGDSVVLIGRALSRGIITMANNTIRFTLAPPPTLTIDGGDSTVTKDTTPQITGTTSAASGRTVTVTVVDRHLTSQTLTGTVQNGGSWSVPATTQLAAGNYTVTASVTDAAGNGGVDSQRLTVEVNPDPVDIGSAGSFSVLAGTGVTGNGVSTVSGDLGLSPSGAITGFPPGVVSGDIHDKDATAAQAQADRLAAYNEIDGRAVHQEIVGDLAGQTFHAGIYHKATALALTGIVTLDAENDPNAIFIFQGDAAMNTANPSQVMLANGAKASNVFWQINGAVTLATGTQFAGTILAAGGVTSGAGNQIIGRALSAGTVTLADNTIRFTDAPPPTITIAGGSTAVTKDTTPQISGTTTATAGQTVTVRVDGQVLTTTVQSGGGWAVTASALTAGTYAVVASVRTIDGEGAKASQQLTVEVNPDPVALGAASTFSVLAGTGVTSTGSSTLTHNLGTTGGAITGFPPGIVSGTIHDKNAYAGQANVDLVAAYNDLDARTAHREFDGILGGQTFHAGIYHSTAALDLTGTVTLDAENNASAVFIFQGDGAMNSAASGTVVLANGAQASNVYWQVEGAVGAGASSVLAGTFLTPGAITLGNLTTLTGRALSGAGTVTMANNIVN